MKTFSYQAQTQIGTLVAGFIQANDSGEAQKVLSSSKLKLLSIEEKQSLLSRISIFNKVSLRDKALFARQLATMISAGLPIVQAMRVVEQQLNNKRFKSALNEIMRDIEGGYGLSTALAKHDTIFDKIFVSLTHAGENSGQLDDVLNELADRLENDTNFQNKIKSAMYYPAFVLIVMMIMGIYVTVQVIPQLIPLFEDTGTQLPMSTKILIFFSTSLVHFWYVYIVGIIGLIIGGKVLLSTETAQDFVAKYSVKVPMIGPLLKGAYMTSFLKTFSMLARAGIPIIEAIRLTADSIGNRTYKRALLETIPKIEKGIPLSVPLSQDARFPFIIGQMVLVGEQTGRMDSVLATLGRFYANETEMRVKGFASIIEPVIIGVMGMGVAFLVFAVIGPIFAATQNMANAGG